MKKQAFLLCMVAILLIFKSFSKEVVPVNDTITVDTIIRMEPFLSQHISVGVSVGAKVGGNSYLYFSPFIGLQFNRFFPAVGVSFSQYTQNSPFLKEERIGIRGLVRYRVYKGFYSTMEYDGQRNSVPVENGFEKQWTNNLMLGAGVSIPITYDSRVTFELLYLLNYKPGYSPYGHRQSVGRIGLVF